MVDALMLDGWDWRKVMGLDSLNEEKRLTVQVPTKNRPQTLQGFLSCLLGQSFTSWDLVIVDESDEPVWKDRGHPLRVLLDVMARTGHKVKIYHATQLGIPASYNVCLENTETILAIREEDDHVWEADYLKRLVDAYDYLAGLQRPEIMRGVGAVAGQSLSPYGRLDGAVLRNPEHYRNFFYWGTGMDGQAGLIPDDDQRTPVLSSYMAHRVDVLHGMWLYDVAALRACGGFSTQLGPLGHREETEASLRLGWSGYSLWVCPQAIAYHLEAPGGSRINDNREWHRKKAIDERIFQRWLREKGDEGCPIPIDLHPERLQ